MSILMTILSGQPFGGGVVDAAAPTTDAGRVAQRYATLSGATTSETAALIQFAEGLESDGLFEAVPFFWPLVGSSADNKRFNLMDPLDDTAAGRLTYAGTPLSHAKGLQWQAGQGATIQVEVKNLSGVPLIGGGCYAQDTNLRYAFLSSPTDFNLGFNDGGKTYIGIGASSVGVTATPATGLLYGQREDASTVKSYGGETLRTTEGLTINAYTSASLTLDGVNNPVVSCYFILNKALDATERTNFNNRISTLMSALGRAV